MSVLRLHHWYGGLKNHMSGQCRLYCDLCGLSITDFTDHNNVRVLSQDRTQTGSKGQINFWINLNLADPGELIFYRIFDRDDVFAAIIQMA